MPEPDQYATEQAATLRDDWQFSRIFADNAARPGFTALLGLRAEMQQVIAQAAEPGIAAMKFEWWRNEIERAFIGKAQHPLARALGIHLGKAGSSPEYCIELVDAAETESETEGSFTEQDFRLYLYRSGGVLAEQLTLLSGQDDRHALNAARRLGQLKRFTDMVLATGTMLRAGYWLFPVAWLEEHRLDARALLENAGNKADVSALLGRMLSELDRSRVETRTAMEDLNLPAALNLQWSLAQRDYTRFRDAREIALLSQPATGHAFRRLWLSWRAARASARI